MTLQLWTAPTPNGLKVSIMLEELIEANVSLPPIDVRSVDLFSGEHLQDDYKSINPNLKIPTLVDDGKAIIESCAILQYLGERFPSPLLPLDERKWLVMPWVFWQAANVGPAYGNKLSYTRYLVELDPVERAHPLERFGQEALRLTGVLSEQLGDQPFVCGDEMTIADIAIYPWLRGWKWSKVDVTGFPNVMAWIKRVRARPGVDRGLKYGSKLSEVDQWSPETKARYAEGGARLASLRSDPEE